MNEISQAIKNLKQSKQWKYLNDKTNALMVSLDDTKTAIIKACNHDIRPPKEKHVRSMVYSLIFHLSSLTSLGYLQLIEL